jgi:hypothetical protein
MILVDDVNELFGDGTTEKLVNEENLPTEQNTSERPDVVLLILKRAEENIVNDNQPYTVDTFARTEADWRMTFG